MTFLLAILVSFGSSLLTFFTGFGLGTVLLAAFLLLFPVELAIAATAAVHLANNIFKVCLVRKFARREVVVRFGIPALAAALFGAWTISMIGNLPSITAYDLLGRTCHITPIKALIGFLIALFAFAELLGLANRWVISPNWMPLGGLLSGFFGGLSGHQGAFRTMFLLKSGLTKEELIGCGAVIGLLVDAGRLTIYWNQLMVQQLQAHYALLAASIAAAIVGTIVGNRTLQKVTLKGIETAASVLLLAVAVALTAGLL